jgi:hypothetical protein
LRAPCTIGASVIMSGLREKKETARDNGADRPTYNCALAFLATARKSGALITRRKCSCPPDALDLAGFLDHSGLMRRISSGSKVIPTRRNRGRNAGLGQSPCSRTKFPVPLSDKAHNGVNRLKFLLGIKQDSKSVSGRQTCLSSLSCCRGNNSVSVLSR